MHSPSLSFRLKNEKNTDRKSIKAINVSIRRRRSHTHLNALLLRLITQWKPKKKTHLNERILLLINSHNVNLWYFSSASRYDETMERNKWLIFENLWVKLWSLTSQAIAQCPVVLLHHTIEYIDGRSRAKCEQCSVCCVSDCCTLKCYYIVTVIILWIQP